jgi:transcriptional regulator of acetoin/glycerol metabolism
VIAAHFPPLGGAASTSAPAAPSATLEDAERRFLEAALSSNAGNIRATARALGIARNTLYRKMAKYGLAASE